MIAANAREVPTLSAHARSDANREAVEIERPSRCQVELYAKREDCNSGLAFGGNKLRKLEYIIPDAIAPNADILVSISGLQSNHTRPVATVAAKIGMKRRLVQEAWVPHEDAVYDREQLITEWPWLQNRITAGSPTCGGGRT
jgi:1-aminocyclopropane-1-carboxylate deaminase/D-cysteine desulfhydrase-like pyridoxal-dependent ACC family enzyme